MSDNNYVISFKNVSFHYENGDKVLDNVSFLVPRGEFLVIIGPNGGGKTTLLKLILGLVKPTYGEIQVLGRTPGHSTGCVGYVPQDTGRSRDFPISVLDVVLMGRLGGGRKGFLFSQEDHEIAMEALARLGMADQSCAKMGELSQGQRQRVFIARALASRPQILLMDEPMASIDPEARGVLYEELASLAGSLTILVVSHDLSVIASGATAVACVCSDVYYHNAGEITEEMLAMEYGGQCPVELVAHGVPHRVLARHDHAPKELSSHD